MTTKLAIVGAGSVGLVLAGRLARSGADVVLVTRGETQAEALRAEGVRVEDPASGAAWRASLPVLAGPGPELEGRLLVACVRTAQVPALADALARQAPGATVAAAQNGLDADGLFARRFPEVLGLVVRFTATRIADAAVRTTGRGRLVVGRYPEGAGPRAEALAAALEAADFDVGISRRIAEDRRLKLCINLMSAPNAMIRREDHDTPAFVELKAGLLEEAAAVLAAAGLSARSCDGRDRSLPEEIAHQRGALSAGTSARRLPLYNQVWRALREGGPVEADEYHRAILELARRHDVLVPLNARMLAAIERAEREGGGPEALRAGSLLEGGQAPG